MDVRTARNLRRFAAGSGIASAALGVVGALLPGSSPSSLRGDPPLQIAGYFEVHQGAIEAGVYILALSAVALILFLGGLRWTLAERYGPLSAVAFAAGIAGATLQLAGLAIWLALAERAGGALDLPTATSMAETGNAIAGFSWFAFAVMFAVTAYLSLAEDALPAWVGWLSAALVPLSLVSAPIAGSAVESVTAIGLAAWVAGISVISLRGQLQAGSR